VTPLQQAAAQRISVATERLRHEARMPAAEPAPVAVQPHALSAVEAEPLRSAEVEAATAGQRFVDPLPEDVRPVEEVADSFIPPQAERPLVRAPRMPRVDELPLPAQNQLRAASAAAVRPNPQPVEAKRMTLLQRLAAVGLGRRDDPAEAETAAPAVVPAPLPQLTAQRQLAPPVASPSAPRRAPAAPAAAPRASQSLDQHGRSTPQRTFEDDQLEIPAFLRRQTS